MFGYLQNIYLAKDRCHIYSNVLLVYNIYGEVKGYYKFYIFIYLFVSNVAFLNFSESSPNILIFF